MCILILALWNFKLNNLMEVKILKGCAEIAQTTKIRTFAKRLRHIIALTVNSALDWAVLSSFMKRFPVVWSVHKLRTALLYKKSFIQAPANR